MEKEKALLRVDAESHSPWDLAVLGETSEVPRTESVVPWTREYNVEMAVAEAEQCARTTRGTILWGGAWIDGLILFLMMVYCGMLFGIRRPFGDLIPIDREAVLLSRVVGVVALLLVFLIGLRCLFLLLGTKSAVTMPRERCMWILDGARYCTVVLLLMYGSSSILLLLFWNALRLKCFRSFLDWKFLHTYWMIPPSWARCVQRHSYQLYLPLLVLFILEVVRYFILQSYIASFSPAHAEVDRAANPNTGDLEVDGTLRAPLLTSSLNVPAARWWNSDYWTVTSPRHRPSSADLAQLHDAWSRRSELEGPLWWSRDEEDIERDL